LFCGSLFGAGAFAPAAHAVSVTPTNASVTTQATNLAAPVVGVTATPDGKGFWRVARDGGVLTAGDAKFYGSMGGKPLNKPIVGMAATPTGHGYWLVASDGGIFTFGDARFHGSMGGTRLNKPIVGMAATPTGHGYWEVASDGGIFTFNAPFRGSTGSYRLNKPIVGMAATPTGNGYWLVASDGGIFTFNAPFHGSMGGRPLNKPVVGMAATTTGSGYTLVAADGGLFQFGKNVPFYGSAANACPGAPAVGVANSPGAVGYWIAFANAQTYAFSPSSHAPSCVPTGSSLTDRMVEDLFTRLNQERAGRGLPALQWDPLLAGYASNWSAHMASNGFSHSDIGSLLGPYDFVGENIAAGSAGVSDGALHNAWMHSDGHRSNMLNNGFTHVGIGAFCDPGHGIWLTTDFGRLSSQGQPPPGGGTPPLNPIERPDSGNITC
jgi:uncharacterized protein YkwD